MGEARAGFPSLGRMGEVGGLGLGPPEVLLHPLGQPLHIPKRPERPDGKGRCCHHGAKCPWGSPIMGGKVLISLEAPQ